MTLDPALLRRARRLLSRALRLLKAAHHEPDLGNLENPLDELIYILLSGQTHQPNFARTWASLRQRFPTWGEALRAGPEAIEDTIRLGGLAKVKARQIWSILRLAAEQSGGEPTLDFLRRLPTTQAERWLVSLPGVGLKTARCVLLFALGRKVFPVDTHAYRVLSRLGLVPRWASLTSARAHDYLQALVRPKDRKDLHVYLIAHGRSVCRPVNPRCGSCPIERLCPKASLPSAP